MPPRQLVHYIQKEGVKLEYSIHELSRLSGVSARTLRWYDEIGLLKPGRVAESGYRYYSPAQVNRLQDILFYRALGVKLSHIRECIDTPSFNRLDALRGHLETLQGQKSQLENLIQLVQHTISCEERKEAMKDEEKFIAFKQKTVKKNEAVYGKEARRKYGDAAVEKSNSEILGMTPEEYAQWNELNDELRRRLEAAVREQLDPTSKEGRAIFELHHRWLRMTDKNLTAARHKGITELYVMDERFTAYYDRNIPGCAKFLRDAVAVWGK